MVPPLRPMFSMDFAVSAPFPLKSGLVFLKSGLVFLKSGKSILVDPRSKIQDFLGVLAQESWICGSKISQEESPGIFKPEQCADLRTHVQTRVQT